MCIFRVFTHELVIKAGYVKLTTCPCAAKVLPIWDDVGPAVAIWSKLFGWNRWQLTAEQLAVVGHWSYERTHMRTPLWCCAAGTRPFPCPLSHPVGMCTWRAKKWASNDFDQMKRAITVANCPSHTLRSRFSCRRWSTNSYTFKALPSPTTCWIPWLQSYLALGKPTVLVSPSCENATQVKIMGPYWGKARPKSQMQPMEVQCWGMQQSHGWILIDSSLILRWWFWTDFRQ